ncbi:uncharacterized protein LOC111324600 isoform X3 [Stylophora pistillata]|uniref:uncharacterized protein LOC111324600 isoform X3 n=1 Tax=Stylophora pistillata TaxID=50429 RepID=UPI000C054851|nr:uncharacterized protein LOC111324600 isoform X3 [Stylophora pistillata]
METTTQREPRSDSADHKVESKQKKCLSTRAVRIAAVLVGISLAAVAVLSAYAAGAFDSNPDLPEIMEGEATLTTDDGKGEVFHVMIDYKRKLIQLTSLNDPAASPQLFGRRLMSFEENKTANGTRINATKIVLQDYNAKTKYFIVPEHGNSTTKCIYTNLEGDMIPRHLLKHATLKSESVEGNTTHSLYQVENDTDVDVYRAKGYNGKIYEVYLHLPNGSIHMRSKEKEMNFTDYKHLNCYRYIEENDTIEEAFHRSNDSKLYQESTRSSDPELEKNIQETSSNLTQLLNQMTSFGNESLANQLPMISRRRRRGIGWRGGSLDWWYGNWCGGYQGGYTRYPKPSCNDDCWRTTSYVNSACRRCLPTINGLDEACMEHDRCIIHRGGGPWWCQPVGNPCKCDSPFVWRVHHQMSSCSPRKCRSHARQVYFVFKHLLSCWFPVRICFPWIRIRCGCKWCTCPRISIYWKCIEFKMCAFFGSGEVFS